MALSQPKKEHTSRGQFAWREGGTSNGQPLVLIHGWPESSYCWEHVAAHLAPGFRIIAPDLRGLGDSERTPEPEAYLKAAMAQDVISLLDHLNVRDFQLVGHDWGGVVAQEVALAIPDRVQRLVIMNIAVINNLKGNQEVIEKVRSGSGAAYWYQHFMQTHGLPEAMIPGAEEAWLGHFLTTWNREPFPQDAFDEYVRTFRIPGTPRSSSNYYRTFRDDAKRWATTAGHRWPMPSMYLYGNKDKVIIPEYLNHIESCFDTLRVEQIEAGHFLQEEQPAAVAHYLSDFLQSR